MFCLLTFRSIVSLCYALGMATTTKTKMCAFPECNRPAQSARTGGRPGAYCDLPEHNRTSAFKARQALSPAKEDADQQSARSTSLAGARLRFVVEELGPLLKSHRAAVNDQILSALAALDTINDPSQVEAEIAALAAAAASKTSQAEAETATQTQLAATAQAATQAAQGATVKAEEAHQQTRQELEAVTAERDNAIGLLKTAEKDLAATRKELTAATAGNEKLTTERNDAIEAQQQALTQAATAQERADQASANAETRITETEKRLDTLIQKLS